MSYLQLAQSVDALASSTEALRLAAGDTLERSEEAATEAQQAAAEAAATAASVADLNKVNKQFPFTFVTGQAQYDVGVISGDSTVTTASMALITSGLLDYAFTINDAKKFTLNSPGSYTNGAAMRLVVSARFDDLIRNFDDLQDGFSAENAANYQVEKSERTADYYTYLGGLALEMSVPYAPGIAVIRPTQTVTQSDVLYRPRAEALPFETGEWVADVTRFVVASDMTLRQELVDDVDPTKGAGKLGWDGQTVGEQMDQSKKLADYTALGNYTGSATRLVITQSGIAGTILRDPTVTASDGGTTFLDGLGRGWRRPVKGTVLVSWFDDGIVNHSVAFQAALNTGAKRVVADPNGIYTLPTGIVSSAPGQKLILTGAVLTLTSSVLTTRAIMMTGDQSRLVGGEITSTQRMNMLVTAGGKDCRIEGAEVYFATPPNRYPLDENTIVYNQGGIELIGVGSSATDNEVYNLMGMGIISYHADQKIEKNHCHHNGMGAHVNHAEPGVVSVRDNIFENNDSIGVLANQDGVVLSFYGNTLRGNGSHGAYLRCQRSMVGLNIAYSNYRYGIKVRDASGTVVFANSTFYNNVSGASSGIELTLQINEFGAEGVEFVANTAKSTDTALTQSFAVNWAGSSPVNDRMALVGNTFENASAAYSSAPVIVGNNIKGTLTVAAATTLAPSTQINALVSSNYIGTLSASNRCDMSHIAHNMIGVMATPIDGPTKFNRIIGNVLYNQSIALERRFFEEFSGNRVKITATLATPVLKQANNAAENSGKTIVNNRITGNTTALIADSSTANSGNYNNVSFNMSDIPAGNAMISMWGTGHTMIGNVNTSGGGTGFIGATNSWLIGNSPKMVLRAEGTGNQNI